MHKKMNPFFYLILLLMIIGLTVNLVRNLMQWLVPLVLLAIVVFFYKYPPHKGRGPKKNATKQKPIKKTKPWVIDLKLDKKPSRFQVIDGDKNKKDDDPPRYH